jgi:predicted lipoprotein with Yx(FWY)xxD motif
MNIRTAFFAVAALAFVAGPALAEDLNGGLVKTATIDGKEALTAAANGMTLYIWDKDAVGVTNCYEQCAVNWPPLLAEAGATASGDFTVVARTDGTAMWAYKGWPLYYWIQDTAPGQATGEGKGGGTWHVAVK